MNAAASLACRSLPFSGSRLVFSLISLCKRGSVPVRKRTPPLFGGGVSWIGRRSERIGDLRGGGRGDLRSTLHARGTPPDVPGCGYLAYPPNPVGRRLDRGRRSRPAHKKKRRPGAASSWIGRRSEWIGRSKGGRATSDPLWTLAGRVRVYPKEANQPTYQMRWGLAPTPKIIAASRKGAGRWSPAETIRRSVVGVRSASSLPAPLPHPSKQCALRPLPSLRVASLPTAGLGG